MILKIYYKSYLQSSAAALFLYNQGMQGGKGVIDGYIVSRDGQSSIHTKSGVGIVADRVFTEQD